MSIEQLLLPDTSHDLSYPGPKISNHDLKEHYESILEAYFATGIDPQNKERLCPGLTENSISFQANVSMTPNGVRMGTHYLISNADNTHVNEVDIFAWNGELETSSGRLIDPNEPYLRDYLITQSGLALVTSFIIERCETGQFKPIKEAHTLSLPQ